MKGIFLHFVVGGLSIALGACASGRAHDNFKQSVQWDIGKSASDPNVLINRYPEDRGASKPLPNGNTEQEYRFRRGCLVYFEIDSNSKNIIGWRYEGSEDACVLVP